LDFEPSAVLIRLRKLFLWIMLTNYRFVVYCYTLYTTKMLIFELTNKVVFF